MTGFCALPTGASMGGAAETGLCMMLEPSDAATATVDIRPIKARLDNEVLFMTRNPFLSLCVPALVVVQLPVTSMTSFPARPGITILLPRAANASGLDFNIESFAIEYAWFTLRWTTAKSACVRNLRARLRGSYPLARAIKTERPTCPTQTVANVLRRYGIAPAPKRRHRSTGKAFISAHMAVFSGVGFFSVEVLT